MEAQNDSLWQLYFPDSKLILLALFATINHASATLQPLAANGEPIQPPTLTPAQVTQSLLVTPDALDSTRSPTLNANVVVTGYTSSSDFPTTPGSYDTTHNGDTDTFVLQLNEAGDALTVRNGD